jgi:3-ketoacyl-CoA synthase
VAAQRLLEAIQNGAAYCHLFVQGGMGCSAGVIALGLAQDLLQAHPGSLALIVSHENICNATYTGAADSLKSYECIGCQGPAIWTIALLHSKQLAKHCLQDRC